MRSLSAKRSAAAGGCVRPVEEDVQAGLEPAAHDALRRAICPGYGVAGIGVSGTASRSNTTSPPSSVASTRTCSIAAGSIAKLSTRWGNRTDMLKEVGGVAIQPMPRAPPPPGAGALGIARPE